MAENGRGMGQQEAECAVCVAVNIRPLIGQELVEGCQECLQVTPGVPQVACCSKEFMFDRVYGNCGGNSPDNLFPECVQPLVEGLFKGYNATVFAYGQTGSGKTYTMGSAFTPGGNTRGVIPTVLDQIFGRIKSASDVECTVRVSFVEIHKEDIRDLLELNGGNSRAITVREVPGGGVCLAGATEKEVVTENETADLLAKGTLCRATAATGMNAHSSRSHAIFTITVEQRKQISCKDEGAPQAGSSDEDGEGEPEEEEAVDDFLTAKMHLVDLAGSERAKRTKAEGQRLQEAIDINKGLLALGKVISALVENQRHIPYRDSKLTRLLQDSLGGNSRTVMIACVSPADINLEESLNTLRYANRARNIKNKPVVNRDPMAAQIAYLRAALASARSELTRFKKSAGMELDMDGSNPFIQEALEQLEREKKELEADAARLRVELDGSLGDVDDAKRLQVEAQCQRDVLKMENKRIKNVLQELQNRGVDVPLLSNRTENSEPEVMQEYLDKIAELELENKRLKQLHEFSASYMENKQNLGTPLPTTPRVNVFGPSSYPPIPGLESVDAELEQDVMAAAEEEEYRLEQKRLGEELNGLNKVLQEKEQQMQRVMDSSGNVSMLKAQYEKQLRDLEKERAQLQKERTDLFTKLQNLQATTSEDRQRVEERYRSQLKEKDCKLKELRKREKEYVKLERMKTRSDETCRKLKNDIEKMKHQKVQLVRQIDQRNKEYAERMKQKDKEMLQLKKQGRVAAAKIQRIEALHAKQQAVLKRKTEEAEAARRRLKEIVSVSSRNQNDRGGRRANNVECQPNQNAPLLRDEKARREWIDRELDLCNQSAYLRHILDGEVEMRKDKSKQMQDIDRRLAYLDNPALSPTTNPELRHQSKEKLHDKREKLQEDVMYHSQQIAELQPAWEKARSDEESKGGAAGDPKRWVGIRNVVESRAMLRTLFKCANELRMHGSEYKGDNVKLLEENSLLQEQMLAVEEENQALRIRNAKVEAAAATAVVMSARTTARDDDDRYYEAEEVEELIQELDYVANTPIPKGSTPRIVGEVPRMGSLDDMEQDEVVVAEPVSSESDTSDEDYQPTPNIRENRKRDARPQTPDERLVLDSINTQRRARGELPSERLTLRVLEEEIKRVIPGWTKGRKRKEEVIAEYKSLMFGQRGGPGGPYTAGALTPTDLNIEGLKNPSPQAVEFLKKRKEMMGIIEQHRSNTLRRASTFATPNRSFDAQQGDLHTPPPHGGDKMSGVQQRGHPAPSLRAVSFNARDSDQNMHASQYDAWIARRN